MYPSTNPTAIDWTKLTVAPTKPVGVLSSQAGLNTLNSNVTKLGNIERSFQLPALKPTSGLNSSTTSVTPPKTTATASVPPPAPPILRPIATSPVSSQMAEDVNQTLSAGGLTAAERAALSGVQGVQDDLMANAAKARAALEINDYTGMNTYVKNAEAQKKAYEEGLADFYKTIRPLRDNYSALMTPSEKEQTIQRSLNDIRSQADSFALQTEQDKFNEYQGQTLGFAGGRAAEIDLRASFKNQEYALKEKNLLAELGLEQDLRKMKLDAAGQAITNIKDDFELQVKIEDKLNAIDNDIFIRAENLEKESKNTLINILDKMAGVNPDALPEATLANLEQIAARANLPFDLVTAAMKADYMKEEYKNAKEGLLSVTEAKELGVPYGTMRADAFGLMAHTSEDDGKTFDRTSGLRKEFNGLRTSAQLDDVKFAFSSINEGVAAIEDGAAPGISDQAIIRGFVRMTDPGSVVREGEFALSTQGQSTINQVRGWAESKLQGGVGLTAEERAAIQSLSTKLYADYVRRYNKEASKYRSYAEGGGLNPDDVASFIPTAGLIDAKEAREGDILILDGQPYEKRGNKMEKLSTNTPSKNRPQQNNNPLNIKASKTTMAYDGVTGLDPKPAADGGKFLVFESPEAGFNAAKRLLQSPNYQNLTVDAAMKRWSNNGYGGSILPALKNKTVAHLTAPEIDALISAMAKREGYA